MTMWTLWRLKKGNSTHAVYEMIEIVLKTFAVSDKRMYFVEN